MKQGNEWTTPTGNEGGLPPLSQIIFLKSGGKLYQLRTLDGYSFPHGKFHFHWEISKFSWNILTPADKGQHHL